ncbi:NADH:flavin oxidoreductase [Sphingomonas colocasiae]|uniref:NADH:flavin oxidoreductase n=1 Tax=Sphingomonas colocasiae TaxID=1848973 RepID=A0ABS7PWW4_9SPHN|nr:NADH:flavin oxidoreductase [Sphingomonas colocasiae]MBY8825631.1 NADH:flavin oxidoreductase [Sphingomonas colocasiae]
MIDSPGADDRPDTLAALFTPFEQAGLSLRNRIVMAPMTRWKSPGQYPAADVAGYYRRRAENEVGLIITEGTTIGHPVSSYSTRVPAFHGEALSGWRRVVEEVHDAGGKIIPQLWHVGIMRDPRSGDYPNPDLPSASPSGIYKPGGKAVFPPMTRADIAAVIDSFAEAAAAARATGFDGIEIHGAHGYIIDQFLWDALNTRDDDDYGGGPVERTRFAVELIEKVRAATGPDFPILLRISQWKQQDYAARLAETPERLKAILDPIAAAGVDIFHCSERRYWNREFPGSEMNLAGWVKRLTGRPTITVGSVGLAGPMSVTNIGEATEVSADLAPLARRIAHGEFDLVAVGRALLTDPGWARKVKQGRFDELRPFTKDALDILT